jgi:predicted Zn-ribbon and HTH transcriptional regulator
VTPSMLQKKAPHNRLAPRGLGLLVLNKLTVKRDACHRFAYTHTYNQGMKVTLTVLKCKKCGHEWIPRHPQPPKVCPECKRYDWQEDRKKK